MELLDLLTVPFLLVFALATSVDDVRKGKIRNTWIIAALLFALLALAIQSAVLLFQGSSVNERYLLLFAANGLVALAIASGIWLASVWSAGDTKLFLAYAMLLPLEWYRRTWTPLPALTLLTNVAVLALALLTAQAALRIARRPELFLTATRAFPRKQPALALFVFGFSWLSSLLLGPFLSSGALALATLALYLATRSVLRKHLLHFAAMSSLARLLLDSTGLAAAVRMALPIYLAVAVVSLLMEAAKSAFVQEVPGANVEEGMIPRDAPVEHRSEGLTAQEASAFRLAGSLRIAETMPFAPLMALAALLTALAGGDLLALLL